MSYIFISYERNTASESRAKDIALLLTAMGWSVWDYQVRSEQSQAAIGGIREGLAASQRVVSFAQTTSPWVKYELALATRRGLRIETYPHHDHKAFLEAFAGIEVDDDYIQSSIGRHRSARRARRIALVLIPMVCTLLGLASRTSASASEVLAGPAWPSLQRTTILSIPAGSAIGYGIPIALVLMLLTWNMANEVAGHRTQLRRGQMWSWVVASGFLLGLSSLGLVHAATATLGPWVRTMCVVLASSPIVLFALDGRHEGRRLGVI